MANWARGGRFDGENDAKWMNPGFGSVPQVMVGAYLVSDWESVQCSIILNRYRTAGGRYPHTDSEANNL